MLCDADRSVSKRRNRKSGHGGSPAGGMPVVSHCRGSCFVSAVLQALCVSCRHAAAQCFGEQPQGGQCPARSPAAAFTGESAPLRQGAPCLHWRRRVDSDVVWQQCWALCSRRLQLNPKANCCPFLGRCVKGSPASRQAGAELSWGLATRAGVMQMLLGHSCVAAGCLVTSAGWRW